MIVSIRPIRDRQTPMMEMISNASSASADSWLHPSLLAQISYSVQRGFSFLLMSQVSQCCKVIVIILDRDVH